MESLDNEPPRFKHHCSMQFCENSDFIPVKCDNCLQVFCCDHIAYKCHSCSKSGPQVPICPLCNNFVTSQMYGSLDLSAKVHVDQECESDIAKARRKWTVKHIKSCAW